MRHRICATVVVCLACTTAVFATPPESIKLDYDSKEKILHIEVTHVTHNLRQHHLRRIMISRNGEEVGTINMTTQKTSSSVLLDAPLEANPGDKITVEAQCNKSGPREETLIIPQ